MLRTQRRADRGREQRIPAKARFDDNGNFTLMLVDGGQKVYHVDDCTAAQLKEAIELLKKNNVPVLK